MYVVLHFPSANTQPIIRQLMQVWREENMNFYGRPERAQSGEYSPDSASPILGFCNDNNKDGPNRCRWLRSSGTYVEIEFSKYSRDDRAFSGILRLFGRRHSLLTIPGADLIGQLVALSTLHRYDTQAPGAPVWSAGVGPAPEPKRQWDPTRQ